MPADVPAEPRTSRLRQPAAPSVPAAPVRVTRSRAGSASQTTTTAAAADVSDTAGTAPPAGKRLSARGLAAAAAAAADAAESAPSAAAKGGNEASGAASAAAPISYQPPSTPLATRSTRQRSRGTTPEVPNGAAAAAGQQAGTTPTLATGRTTRSGRPAKSTPALASLPERPDVTQDAAGSGTPAAPQAVHVQPCSQGGGPAALTPVARPDDSQQGIAAPREAVPVGAWPQAQPSPAPPSQPQAQRATPHSIGARGGDAAPGPRAAAAAAPMPSPMPDESPHEASSSGWESDIDLDGEDVLSSLAASIRTALNSKVGPSNDTNGQQRHDSGRGSEQPVNHPSRIMHQAQVPPAAAAAAAADVAELCWQPDLHLPQQPNSRRMGERTLVDTIVKEPGLAKQLLVPPRDAAAVAKAERRAAPATAGNKWHDLPATEITEDVKRDLRLLKLRCGEVLPGLLRRFYTYRTAQRRCRWLACSCLLA